MQRPRLVLACALASYAAWQGKIVHAPMLLRCYLHLKLLLCFVQSHRAFVLTFVREKEAKCNVGLMDTPQFAAINQLPSREVGQVY